MVLARNRGSVFHGWWIVLASMLAMLIGSASYYQGFGVFFLALQEEFSTNRAVLSGAIALAQLESGILGPLGGYLVDRYGPRRVMMAGITTMGVGFLAMSQIQSLAMFYVVFLALVTVGVTFGSRIPALVAPAQWFVRRRGLAIGIAFMGLGLGGLFIPVLGWLIADYGWRSASTVIGLTILALSVPLAAVMRNRPEEYGLQPDGAEAYSGSRNSQGLLGRETHQPESRARREWHDPEFTLRQALRVPVFWLLAFAFGLRQFAIGAITLHLVPFLVDNGKSLEAGSAVLAAVTLTTIPGAVACGWLADRFPPRYVMAVSMAFVGLGALILVGVAGGGVLFLILFVLLYSLGWGGGVATMNAVRGAYFGRRALGAITGTMEFCQMFGLVLGPVYAALVFDLSSSYTIAFTSFAASAALGAALMVFLRPPPTHGSGHQGA